MVGDSEASLPSLIEAVKVAITATKAAYEKRGEAMKKAWAENVASAPRQAAAVGWDASARSAPRGCPPRSGTP